MSSFHYDGTRNVLCALPFCPHLSGNNGHLNGHQHPTLLLPKQGNTSTNYYILPDFRGKSGVGAGLSLHQCRTLPGETGHETGNCRCARQAATRPSRFGHIPLLKSAANDLRTKMANATARIATITIVIKIAFRWLDTTDAAELRLFARAAASTRRAGEIPTTP
jgi:hypothetical protein